MIRFSKTFSTALCIVIFLALGSETLLARGPRSSSARPAPTISQGEPGVAQESKPPGPAGKKEKKKKKKKNGKKGEKDPSQRKGSAQNGQPEADGSTGSNGSGAVENIEIISDVQSKTGELYLYEGYVNVTL